MDIEISGRTYPLINIDDFTWDDWAEAERISGFPAATFHDKLGDSSALAWKAFVLISVRRVNPRLRDNLLDDVDFVEVLSRWGEENTTQTEEPDPTNSPGGSSPTKNESSTPTELDNEQPNATSNGHDSSTKDSSLLSGPTHGPTGTST